LLHIARGVRAAPRLPPPPTILTAAQRHWLNYFIILRKSDGSGSLLPESSSSFMASPAKQSRVHALLLFLYELGRC